MPKVDYLSGTLSGFGKPMTRQESPRAVYEVQAGFANQNKPNSYRAFENTSL